MDKKIFLGSILTPQDNGSWRYLRTGALVIDGNRISSLVSARELSVSTVANYEIIQLDGVIMPGFVDVHCHWVQNSVRGVFNGDLLCWLRRDIWPEESRFENAALARRRARQFYRDMLRSGTVMGMSYSSVHRLATEIAITEMVGDWVVGNVLMSVNAPNELIKYSIHDEDELKRFASMLNKSKYAITPRFAPNMRVEDLSIAGRVAQEGNYFVQTHLAESRSEVDWVRKLFPHSANYTDVYDNAGLLGPRSILGHCVEMSNSEWACLAERGCWVAHCPTSNEALGNARMRLEKLREFGVPYALATDIGAGPSHSMLHVIQRFIAVHSEAGVPVTYQEALYRATLAGARAMGRDHIAGNLAPGKRADFVLMPGKPMADQLEGWFSELCQGTIKELEERPIATYLGGEVVRIDKDKGSVPSHHWSNCF